MAWAPPEGEPGTDKYSLGYYPAYRELARRIGPAGRVLEVGVYRGGSLRMWQGLFPGGIIAGVDHDARSAWPDGTFPIITAQDSPSMVTAANSVSPDGWDLIVDDASHAGKLSAATFGLLWPLVRPGGWYVIEDWTLAITGDPDGHDRFDGDSMLRLVESFVRRLEPAPGSHGFDGNPNRPSGSQIGELWYRYGQAMLHKAEAC